MTSCTCISNCHCTLPNCNVLVVVRMPNCVAMLMQWEGAWNCCVIPPPPPATTHPPTLHQKKCLCNDVIQSGLAVLEVSHIHQKRVCGTGTAENFCNSQFNTVHHMLPLLLIHAVYHQTPVYPSGSFSLGLTDLATDPV